MPLCVKRMPDGYFTPLEIEKKNGLVEVDGTGTGCMIMSRRVLEAIKYPFRNEYDADGIKKMGLDFNFCVRAKQKGFKTYTHLDYFCSHHMTVDLKEIYKSFMELKHPDEQNKIN